MGLFGFGKNKEENKKTGKKNAGSKVKILKQPEIKKEPLKAEKISKTSSEGPAVILPKGKSARSYYNIIGPFVTEKAASLNQNNQYVFKVTKQANKTEIKKSIQSLYGVNVVGVRIINLPSKIIKLGKQVGRKPGIKKAIVKLREGQTIEI